MSSCVKKRRYKRKKNKHKTKDDENNEVEEGVKNKGGKERPLLVDGVNAAITVVSRQDIFLTVIRQDAVL